MTTTRACLILNRNNRFESFNSDGRMICHRMTIVDIQAAMKRYEYQQVPPNSRTAKAILDKIGR